MFHSGRENPEAGHGYHWKPHWKLQKTTQFSNGQHTLLKTAKSQGLDDQALTYQLKPSGE